MTSNQTRNRLRIAIQKSGRLSEKSIQLLTRAGLDFDLRKDRLIHECLDFPVDLMLVRDDDIPEYVADGVCDLGIVGQNVLDERLEQGDARVEVALALGFGKCRLSVAAAPDSGIRVVKDLAGKRVATSYPNTLRKFLKKSGIEAQIVELSGAVEIAPGLDIADAVCDLVSSGETLRQNGLRELFSVSESQALFVRNASSMNAQMALDFERLLQRMQAVLQASKSKYIMMNAPRSAIPEIQKIIPGMEEPSVMPLGVDGQKVAIHAVATETIFWETLERLKAVGASSILVLPIEKVIA